MNYALGQQIATAEYFFDNDPGVGNATALTLATGASIDETFSIPTTGLSEGLHLLHIRTQDTNGIWSLYFRRYFFINSTMAYEEPAQYTIANAEYFFDSDPGVGNGIDIPITNGNTINENFSISTTGLTQGLHVLHIRVEDSNGTWSLFDRKYFYVNSNNSYVDPIPYDIVEAEYFFDSDPGMGNGSPLAVTSGNSINESFTIDTSGLLGGLHVLHIRTKDANNTWSLYERQYFYLYTNSGYVEPPSYNISEAEYFFDSDPGVGNGNSLAVASGNTINETFVLSTEGLFEGMHTLHIRAKDENGTWSLFDKKYFFIVPQYTDPTPIQIVGAEYFVDIDPGVGNGLALTVNADFTINETFEIPIECFPVGDHELHIRVVDANGTWSHYLYETFTVDTNDVPPVTICRNITVELDEFGQATISPEDIDNGSYDSCTSITEYSLSQTSFDCTHIGENTVTLTVTNANGFPSTCEAIVTIEDITPPNVITQNIIVDLNANGTVSILNNAIDNGSTDTCGSLSFSTSRTSFDCSDIGDNTVTLTVSDGSGNEAYQNAIVTIVDATPPTVVTQNITVSLDTNGSVSIAEDAVNNGSSDSCGGLTFNTDITYFDCSNIGANTVTLFVTDDNSNTASQTAIVMVEGNSLSVDAADDILASTELNNCSLEVAVPDVIIEGNCNAIITWEMAGAVTDSGNGQIGNYTFPVGDTQITYEVTSSELNTVTDTLTVTITDNENPSIVCPTDINQTIPYSETMASVTIPTLDVSDNCGISSVINDFNNTSDASDTYPLGTTVINWTVTDVNGNIMTCSQQVVISLEEVDVVAPNLDPICENQNNFTLPEGIPSGGTWSGEYVNNNIFEVSQSQPGIYNLTYTALNGESDETTIEILSTQKTYREASICDGETYSFAGQLFTESGTYTVIDGTTLNGCDVERTLVLTVLNLDSQPIIQSSQGSSICEGTQTVLSTSLDSEVQWKRIYNGEFYNLGNSIEIVVDQPGLYEASITNAFGCTSISETFDIQIVSQPKIQLSSLSTICLGETIELSIIGADDLIWSTGEIESLIEVSPTEDIVYTVQGTYNGGCEFTDTIAVNVIPASPPTQVTNMQPVNGAINLLQPITLSWNPGDYSVVFDLYIWPSSEPQSEVPVVSNIETLSYSVNNLEPGIEYAWQVVSKNSCFQTSSNTQVFTPAGIPDLVLENATIPNNSIAGNSIMVSWDVTNNGTGNTNSRTWKDRIYLSSDLDLRRAEDILLAEFNNISSLNPGESYSMSKEIIIPITLSGTYYLFIITDNVDGYCTISNGVCINPRNSHGDSVDESDEQNNFSYESLYIETPPSPDLKIESVGSPLTAFSGDEVTLQYIVENIGERDAIGGFWHHDQSGLSSGTSGGGGVSGSSSVSFSPIPNSTDYDPCVFQRYWLDAVYISDEPEFSFSSAIKLEHYGIFLGGVQGDCVVGDYLSINEIYNKSINVDLPENIFGEYYFYVISNYAGLFEGTYSNNILRSDPINIVLRPPADLTVTSLNVPESAIASQDISITWTVENIGNNPPLTDQWKDKVYISTLSDFDIDEAIYLGQHYFTQNASTNISGVSITDNFEPEDTYIATDAFELPETVQGDYYLYVITDQEADVFEYETRDNNILRSENTISIEYDARPDLVPVAMDYPETITRGESFVFSYQILNIGESMASGFYTKIFWSESSEWNSSEMHFIKNQLINSIILPDNAIEKTITLHLPLTIPDNIYFHIYVDALDAVFEEDELNNKISNQSVNVPSPVIVNPIDEEEIIDIDITITGITSPPQVNSGDAVNLSWNLSNIGTTDLENYFQTRVYLSLDNTLDSEDYYLSNKSTAPLGAGEIRTETKEVFIPNGISGNYNIIVFADYNNTVINETSEANNQYLIPVEILSVPHADLVITNFSAPATVVSGQVFEIEYTVQNQGEGTVSSTWVDQFYLGNLPYLTGNIVQNNIGYDINQGELAPGEAITKTVEVVVPQFMQGNYYLLVKTDSSDVIFEGLEGGNLNNEASQLIFVELPDPTDLLVGNWTVPDDAFLGDDINVQIEVSNIGSNPAIGNLGNALYASSSPIFQGDMSSLVNSNESQVDIQPGESRFIDFDTSIRDIFPGSYFGIARTNILSTIHEVDFTNNILTSDNTMEIDVRELPLETLVYNTMEDKKWIYYKVLVEEDKDLLIELGSSRTIGVNEIFVSYENIPNSNNYDYHSLYTNSTNQKVLVPETQAGYYYILIKTELEALQNIDIIATLLDFSILSSSPEVVGDGEVTTTAIGAGFRNGMVATLVNNEGTTFATALTATLSNSMEATLQWDLNNVPLGVYNLKLTNPDSNTVTLQDALTIETSSGYSQLTYDVLSPSILRRGRSANFDFVIKNNGNVDVPVVIAELIIKDDVDILEITSNGKLKSNSTIDNFGRLQDAPDYVSENGFYSIPFLARDLIPGEEVRSSLNIANFSGNSFPIRVKVYGTNSKAYLYGLARRAEDIRLQALGDPQIFSEDRELVENQGAFTSAMFNNYVEYGYLKASDTLGLEFTCDDCENQFLEQEVYSPGGNGPNLKYADNIKFKPGGEYIWDINKYDGEQGGALGHDAITAAGKLNITATTDNPFTIRVKSLDYSNAPTYLAGWYPAVDKCWVVLTAAEGIEGFDISKFVLDLSGFEAYNYTYRGTFSIEQVNEFQIAICFTSYKPGLGEDGVPGAPGGIGENGSPGGPGGPGNQFIAPGKGGVGGLGGPGYGSIPHGQKGPDGPDGCTYGVDCECQEDSNCEEQCNGLDDDGDGIIPLVELDLDNDGWSICQGDFNDYDSTVYPGAPEIDDGIDNDGDGIIPSHEIDFDNDGWAIYEGDCNDYDRTIHPTAEEKCDGKDNDCDGQIDEDESCEPCNGPVNGVISPLAIDDDGDGWSECQGDCNDNDSNINPGEPDICDGIDNDCDGLIDEDCNEPEPDDCPCFVDEDSEDIDGVPPGTPHHNPPATIPGGSPNPNDPNDPNSNDPNTNPNSTPASPEDGCVPSEGSSNSECNHIFEVLSNFNTVVSCGVAILTCFPPTVAVSGGVSIILCGGSTMSCVLGVFPELLGNDTSCAAGISLDLLGGGVGFATAGISAFVCAFQDDICKPVAGSCDPNEIIGPEGFGPEKFVSKNETLAYTINFENDPEIATAAAQNVIIRQPLNEEFDPASFRLTSFGFGSFSFSIPEGLSNYSALLPLADQLGVDVFVSMGIDVVNSELIWTFQSIDPDTGLYPSALNGFLPINDDNGAGQGFVSYSIKANPNTVTGDELLANANIYFDTNPPIATNDAINIVDAMPPSILEINDLELVDDRIQSFGINAQDDLGGSGVKGYNIYVSEDNGQFNLYQSNIRIGDTFVFEGDPGIDYCIAPAVKDNVNNLSELLIDNSLCFTTPNENEVTIQYFELSVSKIGQGSLQLSPSNPYYPDGAQVTLEAVPNPGWVFNSWSGDIDSTANPLDITMDSDKSIVATFISGLKLDLKLFLQGPLLTPDSPNLMNDHLRAIGFIPLVSPYGDNLTIDQSILDVNGSNAIVDWVWVELRDKDDNASILASTSALLQRDGDVVGVDGISPLVFDLNIDDYYVAVSHRMHLGIITANPLTFTDSVTQLDFTTDLSIINGGDNAVSTMNGFYALYTGDVDGNGQVQNVDIGDVLINLGASFYSFSDLDMNGQVQNTDINILLPNLGLGEQYEARENMIYIIAPRTD